MKAKHIINGLMLTIYLFSIAKLGATALELILQPGLAKPDFMTTTFCVLFVWVGNSYFIGLLGDTRMIGYWPVFFISLILSPIVALIVILFSKRKSTHEYEQKMLKHMETIANEKK